MKIISHRGESNYAPENTMSSFFLAYLNGADGIETDVRKAKDNTLVLHHDKTINRTSNGIGKVSSHNYNELLKYDFGISKGKKYTGEKIPTLKDFLKYFGNKNTSLYIEMKETGYENLVVDLINKYNKENIIVMSFKYEILENICKIDKSIKLGWLLYEINNDTIDKLKKINANKAICTSICLDIDDVNECHNNNFDVVAWGVLGGSDLRRLESIGVDFAIYDSYLDAKGILEKHI